MEPGRFEEVVPRSARFLTACVVLAAGVASWGCRRPPSNDQKIWMQSHCVAAAPKPGTTGFCRLCSISDDEYKRLAAQQKNGELPEFFAELGGLPALAKGVQVCDE